MSTIRWMLVGAAFGLFLGIVLIQVYPASEIRQRKVTIHPAWLNQPDEDRTMYRAALRALNRAQQVIDQRRGRDLSPSIFQMKYPKKPRKRYERTCMFHRDCPHQHRCVMSRCELFGEILVLQCVPSRGG